MGLTGGEADPLVAAGELDVEVGDQSVDVVVPLHLKAERRGEGQVVHLHRVDVHLLKHTHTFIIQVMCWNRWAAVKDIHPPWWDRSLWPAV